MSRRPSLILAATALLAFVSPLTAQTKAVEDSAFMSNLEWRSIGPANMSGRVTDVEGIPGTKTFFVAAAAGGIWKTTNNGTTFRPVFDNERVISMGDLAIAPSNPDIVWAGTGEEDSRNSISPGGGIYKSVDGGLNWQLMGLEDTQAIGRIVIHPTNPDLVYVAALGHPWSKNEERGLYRTKDGGETWELVKYISDVAGFVDVAMHPDNPDVLFAASWERIRQPWYFKSGGPGSALWKTMDGGDTWTEVVGNGFPETEKGRIGLAIAHSNPDVMYAMVEAEAEEEGGELLNGLYRSADGGATWEKMNSNNVRPFYYSQVRVDPSDPDHVFWSSTPVNFSKDGGKTIGTATIGIHVDHHAMWWDPTDPDHFIVGNDGGIGVTWDKGGSYQFVNTFPLGQFYAVSYNMDVPYRVCGGLQDNGTWCGPSRREGGAISNHMWYTVNGGDGFYAEQDPTNPDIMYAESQGGNMTRVNVATGDNSFLSKPNWREKTKDMRDSLIVLEEDEERASTEAGMARIEELKAAISADSALYDLRYNWNTPMVLSPHDASVLYAGANRVLKSTKRGDDFEVISPDLTTGDTMKARFSNRETGGITTDATGAENYVTIVALAESPLEQGTLFVGTDDGNVWVTRDDGVEWIELTGRFPGVPPQTYVSRIEPSSHDASTFYVTFDGHRSGDYTPYVYMTTDGGETFQSISNNLPTGKPDFVHVIREDPVNPNLLFVGTDLGVYVSSDRGGSWNKFMNGLPTVPVHDLKIHPRDRELIAGTHGRSVWIVDIAPLQDLPNGELADEIVVFSSTPGLQFGDAPVGGESTGHQVFRGQSRSSGARIAYYVPESVSEELKEASRAEMRERMQAARAARDAEEEEADEAADEGAAAERPARRSGAPSAREMMQARNEGQAKITIFGPEGDTIQTLTGQTDVGLNTVSWNMRSRGEPQVLSPSERRDSINNSKLLREVADSLAAEGTDKATLDRIIQMTESGNRQQLFRAFGGGGGGGGGQQGGFVERPGENYPPPPREEAEEEAEEEAGEGEEAAAERPGGQAGGAAAGGSEMRDVMRQLFRAMRARGQGGGFGRGGGGGAGDLVEPGEYRAVVTIGDYTKETWVSVVRADGYVVEEDDDDDFDSWLERLLKD